MNLILLYTHFSVPGVYNTINSSLKKERSHEHIVKSFKYEYEKIYEEVCNYLNISPVLDVVNLSDENIEDIFKVLKCNYKNIWKEL